MFLSKPYSFNSLLGLFLIVFGATLILTQSKGKNNKKT